MSRVGTASIFLFFATHPTDSLRDMDMSATRAIFDKGAVENEDGVMVLQGSISGMALLFEAEHTNHVISEEAIEEKFRANEWSNAHCFTWEEFLTLTKQLFNGNGKLPADAGVDNDARQPDHASESTKILETAQVPGEASNEVTAQAPREASNDVKSDPCSDVLAREQHLLVDDNKHDEWLNGTMPGLCVAFTGSNTDVKPNDRLPTNPESHESCCHKKGVWSTNTH